MQEVKRVKMVYEMKQKGKMKEKCEEGVRGETRPYKNRRKKKVDKKGDDESNMSGGEGMEMLLNAAKTLNLQENLAAGDKELR